MRVTLEKLPGVESANVSLNEGRATIQLKPGNAVTLAQVRQSVQRNGFTPQAATVSGRADVRANGDVFELRIVGLPETYQIAGTPHADKLRDQLQKYVGQTVVIEGVIPTPTDRKAAPLIQVKTVKAAEKG